MKVDVEDIRIDRQLVLKFLGYGKKKAPPVIDRRVGEEIDKARSLIDGSYYMDKFNISEVQSSAILLENGYRLEGDYATRTLHSCSQVYGAVYTVGDRLEERIREYSVKREMSRAMILDKIGVVALDSIKELVKSKIKEEIGQQHISAELYPSNGDFLVENQKLIYDLVCKDCEAISIGASNQFLPLKTVAVIFGIGSTESGLSMCETCSEKCDNRLY